jgi:phosphoribosylanthranilate isomerase
MVWVKICGVNNQESAQQVAACRPDAIGLNFYSRSPRVVTADVAEAIARALPETIEAVGVFVNASATEVAATVRLCGLDRVQFHGDEPPELLAEFHRLSPETLIVRAWRFDGSLQPLKDYIAQCNAAGVQIAAVLVDAHVSGIYGGTGVALPWDALRREYAQFDLPPLILAGGLTADNISVAVEAVAPWGVDVASGVEATPGVKDAALVARFINSAWGAKTKPHT